MEERKYTALSGRAWERIAGQDMSPSEAVRYFSQDLCPRTFGEVLSGLMARQGLDREALIGRLWALRGGDIQRESVRRRVSMWLSAAKPAEREELFQLCFALGLDEAAAHAFLRCTQDGDFHLREPREAGYLYGLRAGRTYVEARALLDRLGWADGPFPREGLPEDIYAENLSWLAKIAGLCAQKDIPLALVFHPTYSQLPADFRARAAADAACLDISFFDWTEAGADMGIVPTQHYYDPGHLNQEGASVFSAWLVDFLTEELDLVPRAQEPDNTAAWSQAVQNRRK